MDNTENMKEVYFNKYCKTCQYEKTDEDEEPCSSCLEEPGRQYFHKPEKYMERIKTTRGGNNR